MERLTEKVLGFAQIKECGNDFCKETCAEHDEEKSCKNCPIQKAIKKLAEYEDLEEQGKLLKPPCAVGDTVYEVQEIRKRIQQYEIRAAHVDRFGKWYFYWRLKDGQGIYGRVAGFSESYLGVEVFFTREEAEAALKEL